MSSIKSNKIPPSGGSSKRKHEDEACDEESGHMPKMLEIHFKTDEGGIEASVIGTEDVSETSLLVKSEEEDNFTTLPQTEKGPSDNDDPLVECIHAEKCTNTEDEFVTDLEKLISGFKAEYQNMEIDQYKRTLQKFFTQNLRLATRCQKLRALVEKPQSTTTRILREVSKQVNPYQLSLISSQLINSGKPEGKRAWSPQMKNIMVGLFLVSPAAHRFLSQILVLPLESEINEWIGQGMTSDIINESDSKNETSESVVKLEVQAVLDEIAFENLMATLL